MGNQQVHNNWNMGTLVKQRKAMVNLGVDGNRKAWKVRVGLGLERKWGLEENTPTSNLILLRVQIPLWLVPVYARCRALQRADLVIVV